MLLYRDSSLSGFYWFLETFLNFLETNKNSKMKRITLALVTIALCARSYGQTRLSDVLSGKAGKIIPMSGFKEHVLPYLTAANAMTATDDGIKIIPKEYILPSDTTLKDLIVGYNVKAIDLKAKMGTLIKNFNLGSFNTITLSNTVNNVVFVTLNKGDDTYEGIFIDLFFSQSKKQWVVNAHYMELTVLFKKGTKVITYK